MLTPTSFCQSTGNAGSQSATFTRSGVWLPCLFVDAASKLGARPTIPQPVTTTRLRKSSCSLAEGKQRVLVTVGNLTSRAELNKQCRYWITGIQRGWKWLSLVNYSQGLRKGVQCWSRYGPCLTVKSTTRHLISHSRPLLPNSNLGMLSTGRCSVSMFISVLFHPCSRSQPQWTFSSSAEAIRLRYWSNLGIAWLLAWRGIMILRRMGKHATHLQATPFDRLLPGFV